MNRLIRNLLVFFAVAFTMNAHGQILKDLKKTATDMAKDLNTKENRERVATIGVKNLEKARAEFDSTDFDYAILVSDNSGLFDLKKKGQSTAMLSSAASATLAFMKDEERTDAEKARGHREMGEVYYGNGWFKMASGKFDAAKAAYEGANLTGDIGYIKTIANMGLLYSTMGRYTQAQGYTAEALDLRKEKFGETSTSVAASFNNYGVLKYNLAQYNEALTDIEAATAILKQNKLEQGMPYAIVLNNEAMLLQGVGRYEEAEGKLKEATTISAKLSSTKSSNHAKFLSNLALLYQLEGKYPDAEATYQGLEKTLGKSNPDLATVLCNQAALYMTMGKEDKVEDLLKRALSIYKSNLGEQHPAYARAQNDLGNFYRYKGRYPDAEPALEKALAIREATLGKNHPLYVQSQEDLAILHWKKKAWDKAFMTYREVMDKSMDFINNYFPPMSESEKTKYWDVLFPRFQRFYNFSIEASTENAHAIEAMFDYQIATKGLLLNSTNKVKQAIFASKDGLLIKDYLAWLDAKESLSRLYAYSKEELKNQKINLDSLERATNAMERKLSERSTDFSSGYSVQKVQFSQLQKSLLDNEALVEVVRLQKYDQKFTGESRYVALVLTKNAEAPKMVLLDNGQQLETRYAKFYRNAIHQRLNDEHSYDQYWAKLETELQGKKMIYLSPDGVYSQLNLNTMKKPGADYVINRYDIVVLGNSRDLLALKNKKTKTSKKNATLIGFPDYGGSEIAALPGTKTELDGVSKLLKASAYQVTMFTQKTASEANVKKLKSPWILHFATHGYFLQDKGDEGSAFGIHFDNANDNPLLRSGLMLAGASSTASGKRLPNLESNDNGILTAYEAMNLNLEGTELVLLSACETGLGEVKAGEGVYGLQRAFLVAGADALIMSLWKVDDAATQALMTNFYTNYIKLGNKQKAFKQAQLQLMAKYKDPYYWGAFVMMGN
ncbi:CHAT domain-containing tetratricopeptide repeat protein [Pseudochryseolinea flava]|nr:CHAT domain-containing protein [Pseudochryseolinea flava]